jgi:monoterpene epsilon-lactone hydrolase
MSSISAIITSNFLAIFNFKNMVEKSLQKPSRRNKPFDLSSYHKSFFVSEFQLLGKSVVTLQPKSKSSTKHVLYFHGGAYLLEGSVVHWNIIQNIATKANCTVSYIDYPLAPESTYNDTFDMVQQAYDKLISDFADNEFIFMGDSAGGGLALAFAQKLVIDNAPILPVKSVLFSPWIDISMYNPDLKLQESKDKILPFNELVKAAKKYSGSTKGLNHYLLSPINGSFEGLNPTLVFYGTHELFYPDFLKLREKTKANEKIHFQEFDGMQHVWVLFPIPEAKQAINLTVEFINS